jgi:hypothetical protein
LPGFNILVLNGTITHPGGTGVFSDFTGKDVLGGGVGIDGGAWKFSGHIGGVYGMYPGGH